MLNDRNSANDPFEHLVELTAAAVGRRPLPEHFYTPLAAPLGERVGGFLDRLLLHRHDAANDGFADRVATLRRYYY